MKDIPFIDLHPRSLPASSPEKALAAARDFIREQLEKRRGEARIITGLGLHGDGTPRLRRRVETEVLPGFKDRIEESFLEQGGAVIRLVFKRASSAADRAHLRQLESQKKSRDFAASEERLMVAGQRLDAAWQSLEEGDLRKTRLKVGQLLREFQPGKAAFADAPGLRLLLNGLEDVLRRLGL